MLARVFHTVIGRAVNEDWPIVRRVRGTAACAAGGGRPRVRAGGRDGAGIAVPHDPGRGAEAAEHLRLRGYDCKPQMLELLVENGVVRPSSPDAWTRADVDAAADYFEAAEIVTPYAAMCQTLGCRYADFLQALREAAERESRKYGRRIPTDDQYFVMHRVPRPAVISFTRCDDIRARLERGEEV